MIHDIQCAHHLQIDLRSRSGNVSAPVVRVNWILLVDVALEELVVRRTLEVLEPVRP
jgi:hypothetical protein